MGTPIWERVRQAGIAAGERGERNAQKAFDIQDRSNIEQVLQQYNDPDNPMSYNETVNNILARVKNPQSRQAAMNALGQQEQMRQKKMEMARQKTAYESLGLDPSLSDIDPALAKKIYEQKKLEEILGGSQNPSNQSFGADPTMGGKPQGGFGGNQLPISENMTGLESQLVPEDKITQIATINPQLAAQLQKKNDNIRSEIQRKEDRKYKEFLEDRSYHTKYSAKQEDKVSEMEERLVKQEAALELAQDAFESDETGFLSWNNIADKTGIDALRNVQGAKLTLAAKENLLNNLSRVTAKGQNLWMERRMSTMFPQVGQNKEANQTFATMLQGENLLDQAYINEFNRISQEDENKYGYVRKDAEKRARKHQNSVSKSILDRTKYQTRVVEENAMLNKGLSRLKKEVGKDVPSGTPLTIGMAKLYKQKFGDNYAKIAKKNGYTIPTYDEVKMYLKDYNEYKESI